MSEEQQKVGKIIKRYRLDAEESVEDLSGAVEVEPDYIDKIESGKQVPAQEILALIISHLAVSTEDATKLWELSGHDNNKDIIMSDQDDAKKLNINVPSDRPILYTDLVHVSSNQFGVVFNFVQGSGQDGQATVVSRVGMSHEHAKSVLEVLKKTIDKQTQE